MVLFGRMKLLVEFLLKLFINFIICLLYFLFIIDFEVKNLMFKLNLIVIVEINMV